MAARPRKWAGGWTPPVDGAALLADLLALVACPSVGGAEDGALRLSQAKARRLGLRTRLHAEDLAALRRADGHPGEEVERTSPHTLTWR